MWLSYNIIDWRLRLCLPKIYWWDYSISHILFNETIVNTVNTNSYSYRIQSLWSSLSLSRRTFWIKCAVETSSVYLIDTGNSTFSGPIPFHQSSLYVGMFLIQNVKDNVCQKVWSTLQSGIGWTITRSLCLLGVQLNMDCPRPICQMILTDLD